MAKKLWDKGEDVNYDIERYLASDISSDQHLVKYEVMASTAHAKMLNKIGILKDDELEKIIKTLNEIAKLDKQGNFLITVSDEDVHTKVENYLTEKLGDIGKKIHTYRSRNDQLLVDMRLYNKDRLKEVKKELLELARTLLDFAKKHRMVPMPGYTHLQKAMLSSMALWASSFAEALLDDLKIIENAYELNDRNPLGSAASYGVPEKLDREYTTELLGFAKVQNNVLYCQNSRGKIESAILNSLSQVMITLSRLSQDIVIFSTAEFGYLTLSANISTGSSIMPQKRNPDVAELVIGNTSVMFSYEFLVKDTVSGVPSGYSKGTQVIKEPTIKGFELAIESLEVVRIMMESIKVDKERCIAACTPELFAADRAFELVKKGVPFREAYKIVSANLNDITPVDAVKSLEKRERNGSFYMKLDELEGRITDLMNRL